MHELACCRHLSRLKACQNDDISDFEQCKLYDCRRPAKLYVVPPSPRQEPTFSISSPVMEDPHSQLTINQRFVAILELFFAAMSLFHFSFCSRRGHLAVWGRVTSPNTKNCHPLQTAPQTAKPSGHDLVRSVKQHQKSLPSMQRTGERLQSTGTSPGL
jgi:hypothetical protein